MIGGFVVERLIGVGGMGAVYLATDATLNRRIALKVVSPQLAEDQRYRDRFLREAQLAASLEHPAIVPVYAAGESDGELFLAMRFIEGGSLAQRLERERRLDPAEVVGLLAPIADALDAAHGRGLIHRDVKPGNVLLDQDRAYLADFGLADVVSAPESLVSRAAAELSGTVGYLAPELIEGDRATGQTDQYALACVLFECLTGQRPFDRPDALALVYAHLSEPPPSVSRTRPGLPAAVDAVIARALAKRPEDRYPSCRELVDALAAACGLRVAEPTGRHRRRGILALVAVGLVAVAGGAAIVATRGSSGAGGQRPPPANPLVVIDAASHHIIDRVNAGPAPADVTVGGGAVWVLNGSNKTVTRVDPATHAVIGDPIGIGATPLWSQFGEGALWVTATSRRSSGDGQTYVESLVKVDPATGQASAPIPLPPPRDLNNGSLGGAVWAGAGAVWVVDADGDVVRIDPDTRQQTAIAEGINVWGIVADQQSVWAIGDAHILFRIDPDTGKVAHEYPLDPGGGDLGGPAIGGGSVWVSFKGYGIIARIDTATGRVRKIQARPNIDWVAFADGRLWGMDSLDGTMIEVDPATEHVSVVPIAGTPVSFMAGAGKVWVATNGVNCGPIQHAPGVQPSLLITSDLPLTGPDGDAARPLADAVGLVLRNRHYRAGRFSVGYRACDYGTPNGVSDPVCTAHARAFASDARVIGVVGTWNSQCANDELPILATAPGGPIPMISPRNTDDGVTMTGRPNYARVVATQATQYAAAVMLAGRLGKHRLYVLGDDAVWFRDVVDVPAARLGVTIVRDEGWATTDTDAKQLALRVRRSGADGVVLDGEINEDAGRVIKALRRHLGSNISLIVSGAAYDPLPVSKLEQYAGPAAAGIYLTTDTAPYSVLTKRGQAWVLQFAATQRTGTASPHVPHAAQATEVLLDAIARSDGTRSGVTKGLRSVRVTDGILPDFAFTSVGDIDPANVTVLTVDNGRSAAGSLQPDFVGASVYDTIPVLPFTDGFVAAAGTHISITNGRQEWTTIEGCADSPTERPCHNTGTFRANDQTTARLICSRGTSKEAEYSGPPNGIWTIARRTLTCPGRGTLNLLVKLFISGVVTPNQTTNFGESWVITGGTGRLAHLRGSGTMIEPRDLSHTVLGGQLTGIVQ